MITEALLAGILGSQWAIAQKVGLKADDILAALKDQRLQVYLNQGALSTQVDESITPYTRLTLDLTNARDYEELVITGQWLVVESCTGVDVAAYINTKTPLPDPVYLDRLRDVAYPFQRIYLKHSAQAGKQIVLLVGRNGMRVEPANSSMLRWAIHREPVWVHGASTAAPLAGATLVSKAVTAGKTGRLFGLYIVADEGNRFNLSDGTTTLHYALVAAGQILIVLAAPLLDPIAAAATITVKNVTAGTAGKYYQSGLLYDE